MSLDEGVLDRAYGVMVGAGVGDALGALLEWENGPVSPAKIQWALAFGNGCGGGPHQLAPGQITDDTEQQLCLARGLIIAMTGGIPIINSNSSASQYSSVSSSSDSNFILNCVAREYSRWRWGNAPGDPNCQPFDVGKASGSAFGACAKFEKCAYFSSGNCSYGASCYFSHESSNLSSVTTTQITTATTTSTEYNHPWAETTTLAASQHNKNTKSNGSLMRCMPLAVWGIHLPLEQLTKFVSREACLSHPHPSCVDATVSYVIGCRTLISTGNIAQALTTVQDWVLSSACSDVQTWLREARDFTVVIPFQSDTFDDGTLAPDKAIAFVKWAYTHAFRNLYKLEKDIRDVTELQKASHEQKIPVELLQKLWLKYVQEILIGGGDSDTNAAITGALLGAACGLKGIPSNLVETVLKCDTAKNHAVPGIPRPEFLRAEQLPRLASQLLQRAPLNVQ